MNKITVGSSTRAGSGKQQGESEDFLWQFDDAGAVAAVVGDFARATGSVALAQRAPAHLGAIAARLRQSGVALTEWPRALLYEYGNFLFATNHRDHTARPCSTVALSIKDDQLAAAQQGDVRLALWRNGQLYFPLGGRWQQVVPNPTSQDAPLESQPLALGTGTIASPLDIPAWTTRVLDGDLLLCFTDGLEDHFPPSRMADMLRQHDPADPQRIAAALLEAAFAAHPSDDKTLFIAHVQLGPVSDPVAALLGQLGKRVDKLEPEIRQVASFTQQIEARLQNAGNDAAGTRKSAEQTASAVKSLTDRVEAVESKVTGAASQSSRIAKLEHRVDDLEGERKQVGEFRTQLKSLPEERSTSSAGTEEVEVAELRKRLDVLVDQVHQLKARSEGDRPSVSPLLTHAPEVPVADRFMGGGRKKKKKGHLAPGPVSVHERGVGASAEADDSDEGGSERRSAARMIALGAAVLIPLVLLAVTAGQLVRTAGLLREVTARVYPQDAQADTVAVDSMPLDSVRPDPTADPDAGSASDGDAESGTPATGTDGDAGGRGGAE